MYGEGGYIYINIYILELPRKVQVEQSQEKYILNANKIIFNYGRPV